jgi:hypothetical protein
MLFRNEGGASLDSHAHETITRLVTACTRVAARRMAHPPQSHPQPQPQPRRDGGWGEKGGRGHAKQATKAIFHGFCARMAMCFCGMRGGGMPAID